MNTVITTRNRATNEKANRLVGVFSNQELMEILGTTQGAWYQFFAIRMHVTKDRKWTEDALQTMEKIGFKQLPEKVKGQIYWQVDTEITKWNQLRLFWLNHKNKEIRLKILKNTKLPKFEIRKINRKKHWINTAKKKGYLAKREVEQLLGVKLPTLEKLDANIYNKLMAKQVPLSNLIKQDKEFFNHVICFPVKSVKNVHELLQERINLIGSNNSAANGKTRTTKTTK